MAARKAVGAKMRGTILATLVAFWASAADAAPLTLEQVRSALVPTAGESSTRPLMAQACCKRCSKGQPCGDSCISREKTCHKGPGCAC